MDGWVKLLQFLTSQFGLPGSCAVALAAYLVWQLKLERAAHDSTRDKIDTINEKRIETTASIVLTIQSLTESLKAVQALLSKQQAS